MNAGRLPINAVSEKVAQGREQEEEEDEEDGEGDGAINSLEDLLAMTNGGKRGENGQWQKRSPSGRTATPQLRAGRSDSSRRAG